jgi:hypothetical protein
VWASIGPHSAPAASSPAIHVRWPYGRHAPCGWSITACRCRAGSRAKWIASVAPS